MGAFLLCTLSSSTVLLGLTFINGRCVYNIEKESQVKTLGTRMAKQIISWLVPMTGNQISPSSPVGKTHARPTVIRYGPECEQQTPVYIQSKSGMFQFEKGSLELNQSKPHQREPGGFFLFMFLCFVFVSCVTVGSRQRLMSVSEGHSDIEDS